MWKNYNINLLETKRILLKLFQSNKTIITLVYKTNFSTSFPMWLSIVTPHRKYSIFLKKKSLTKTFNFLRGSINIAGKIQVTN